ncbi:MAG: hypothetical protein L0332_01625, partial [Chloroflexi bacterium]|nr:hypothetical protein [Chloroflexota bacterium]MCI0725415.1 hypothetical protein [Chloroflexota bacterium]
ADLARQEPAQINVTILDAADAPQPVESMLEHAIVFPEPAQEAATEAEATPPAGETTPGLETPAAPGEEVPAEETATEEATSKEEAEELEPEVSVSESEPVYQEREAPPVAETPVAVPSRVRILGKRRPLHHPTWTAVDILMNEPAFRDAQAHSLTSLDREVAGILIGPPPEKQPDGRYVVHVSDTIIARHTKMQGASVTYTPESWRYVNDKLAEMYPDETAVIVGWYHTHPGFGIFLSSMDQFIHQNFFTQIWHVALVLDPLARRSGFFCWDRYKSRVDRYEFPWPEWAGDSW